MPDKYEKSDFSPNAAKGSALGLLAFLAALAFAIGAFERHQVPPPAQLTQAPAPAASPLGEAEFEAGLDRARFDAAARLRLDSYGWADRERRIARIPLARAMAILSGQSPRDARPAGQPKGAKP